jgi:hypothetical protein
MTNRGTINKIVYVALATAGLLLFAATQMGGHTKDWRDGLQDPVVAASTGPVVTPAPAAAVASVAHDQRLLAADLGMASEYHMKAAIQDTNALIADLNAISLPSAQREQELQSALSLARNRCANCANLLADALGS